MGPEQQSSLKAQWPTANLQEAEAVLVSLARKIRNLKGIQEPHRSHLNLIHQRLIENQQIKRQQAEMVEKSLSNQIRELDAENQSLSAEVNSRIQDLTTEKPLSEEPLKQLDIWLQAAQTRFHSRQLDLEEENATLTQKVNDHEISLEEKEAELLELETFLKQLIDEDKKLKKPDKTKELRKNITTRQTEQSRLLEKVSTLTGEKVSSITSIRKILKALQHEFDQIIQKSESLNTQLPSINDSKKKQGRPKKRKSKELTEMDHLIDKVKNIIISKQKLIQTLHTIENDLEDLLNREQILHSELKNELIRLDRQNARTELIEKTTFKRKSLESEINDIKEATQEFHEEIRHSAILQQSNLEEQESVMLQHDIIQELQVRMNDNIEEIKTLSQKQRDTTTSTEIWHKAIVERIHQVRREINLGLFVCVLLSPSRALIRYQTGLYIRRDVILAERDLCQLGFLSPSYLSRIDIFNRLNRHNQQLSIDILNCSV